MTDANFPFLSQGPGKTESPLTVEATMSHAITTEDLKLWSDEPASRPDRARIRARIGGLHCSLCTGTIERALGRHPGVDKVAVSLTHEQALVEYDPKVARPEALLNTLRDIGYTVSDPRKVRPFEEEERDLVREGRRFLVATAFSLIAIALIAHPIGIAATLLPAAVIASLLAFIFLVLRSRGLGVAIGGTLLLAAVAASLVPLRSQPWFPDATPWIVAGMALTLVFGIGNHILRMAYQSLRRGILNQHVLLEIGAFAGIAGGIVGFIIGRPDYPTAAFFAVTELIDKPVRTLSGGNQRRIEIVRATLNMPSLLLMDEPSVGLDPTTRKLLGQHIRGLRETHQTSILWATHLVEEVEQADRIALIVAGRIIRIGTPAEIIAAAGTETLGDAYIALTGVKPAASASAD